MVELIIIFPLLLTVALETLRLMCLINIRDQFKLVQCRRVCADACYLNLDPWMQIFGSAYLGPLGHYFHILLDKIFKGNKDSKTVAKKVLLILPFSTFLFGSSKKFFYTAYLVPGYSSSFIMNDRKWILDKMDSWDEARNNRIWTPLESFQVVLEQLTISPWNNLMFMLYYGLVIEGESIPQLLLACNICCSYFS